MGKWPKKGRFFGPGGPSFDPFFTICFKSLLNMPTNIILKNQKNSFPRKIFKSEKLRKWPKKSQRWPFFWPWRAKFWPYFQKFLQITSNYAHKHHCKKLKIGSLKKFLSPKNCKNGQKRAKNCRFLDFQGRIL